MKTMNRKLSLIIEALENRITPTVNFVEGAVNITGTQGVDYISVVQSANALIVYDSGTRHVFAANQVEQVNVDALAGADTVILQNLEMAAFVNAGAGNDKVSRVCLLSDAQVAECFIDGGLGNDLLTNYGQGQLLMDGNAGNDILTSFAGSNNTTVRGGDGSDALLISGTGVFDSDSQDMLFKL